MHITRQTKEERQECDGRKGDSDTQAPFRRPMVPCGVRSAARRGRGHGVRVDVDAGTRNVEAIGMTTQLVVTPLG
jgi:hypothetical protein